MKSFIFASMKFIKTVGAFVVLTFFLISCGEYQKIVRGDDYELKFIEANRQFEKKTYSRAITLYEQVYQRYPKTEVGQVAYFRMAKSFYEEKDYYLAGYYFEQFANRFPFSENAEEALFMNAMCSVQNSPSYNLDQEETNYALNDLQYFVQRYPNSIYVDSCNNIMDRLRLKIERKRFEEIKLYDKTEYNRAAVASAKSFLEDYPRSVYLDEVAVIEFENAYVLAMNSILSMKKERIEDALSIHLKFKSVFAKKKSTETRMDKLQENLKKELKNVEERLDYDAIISSYNNSNSSSKQKKVKFLEETIARFNIFAEKYPNSKYLEKARGYHKKAEKELNNIN